MNITNRSAFIKYESEEDAKPRVAFLSTSIPYGEQSSSEQVPVVRVVIDGRSVDLTRGDVYELEEFLTNWRVETSL